jgi:hypothetical protein
MEAARTQHWAVEPQGKNIHTHSYIIHTHTKILAVRIVNFTVHKYIFIYIGLRIGHTYTQVRIYSPLPLRSL